MGLFLHLSFHILTGLFAGIIAWWLGGELWLSLAFGFIGGVLIDLDHLIDYFLAFPGKFRLTYFLKGYQFLKSDKIYVLFHGWEYILIFGFALLVFYSESWLILAILALVLGAFFHLVSDAIINEGMTFRGYSLLYRVARNFELEKIVKPEHYQKHRIQKREIFPESVLAETRE